LYNYSNYLRLNTKGQEKMLRVQNSMIVLFLLLFIFGCAAKEENISLKKQEIKKIVPLKDNKKNLVNKNCTRYLASMTHASTYIKNEFEQAYFRKKDFLGAKAQLFLVSNASSGFFAKNINKANTSYQKYLSLAKKQKCKIDPKTPSALKYIKTKIQSKL